MRKRGSTVQKALFLVFALSCIPSSPRCGEGTGMGQSWLAYLLNPSAAYAGRLLEVKDFECVQTLPAVSGPYQVLWASAFGGSAADSGRAVVPCRDGGFAMAGYTSSYGAGSYDCLVLKLDGTGALQWSRTAGGPKFDQAHAVIETSCGRFIAAGETSSWGEGESDGYVLCYDRDGSLLWSRTYGGPSFDRIRSITETAEGTFVLAGYTSSSGAGHKDFWVLTIDGQGRVKRSGTLGLESCDEAFLGIGRAQRFAGGRRQHLFCRIGRARLPRDQVRGIAGMSRRPGIAWPAVGAPVFPPSSVPRCGGLGRRRVRGHSSSPSISPASSSRTLRSSPP